MLLIGPQGGILQGLYTQGAQNNQVIQAISLLRRNIASPLRADDLARQVNMSVSSLHCHFKSVTGFSPLQYHKHLRLHEAQRLMLAENERATNAALSVGYECVTQSNREYKRMFGEPPHRDIKGLDGTERKRPFSCRQNKPGMAGTIDMFLPISCLKISGGFLWKKVW